MRHPVALLATIVTLAAQTAAAQVRDASARVERVGDGVYAILHDDATDEWPHGNTGVIVTDAGLIVVDSTYLPSRARADIALIRAISDKPVRYLLNTHWHFDHNNGAVAYAEAFPGLTVVSERETADFIELNATYWSRMTTAPGSAKRVSLQGLESQLASGQDAARRPLSAEARRQLAWNVQRRQGELAELAALRVVKPDLVFDRELVLVLGGRRIELRDLGRANSPHDVTIYLPEERILFTGDILVQSPLPYLFSAWPVPWIQVLRDLEAMPVSALVPGHGPVMHDHTYTRQVRTLLEAGTTRVAALARQGKTLEQVQAGIDLGDVRKAVPAWSAPELDADWRELVSTLVERAWRGVRGNG
jgi:cyclase